LGFESLRARQAKPQSEAPLSGAVSGVPKRYGVVEGTEVVELADVSGAVVSCGVGSGDGSVGCSAGSEVGSEDGCV
jgi:hypothetical protein